MNNEEYREDKRKKAYELYLQNKALKKARALILKDNKLCAIKVSYNNGKADEYLPIGGGVEGEENVREATIREAKEEMNANIEIVKYLGKKYFYKPNTYGDIEFMSQRIEFYYLCKYLSQADNEKFGLDGEFERPDRTYTIVELTADDLREITYQNIYHMPRNIFDKLLNEMDENREI